MKTIIFTYFLFLLFFSQRGSLLAQESVAVSTIENSQLRPSKNKSSILLKNNDNSSLSNLASKAKNKKSHSVYKLNWVNQNSIENEDKSLIYYPRGMTTDHLGNVITVGYQLNELAPIALIKKYDAKGNLLWNINYGLNSYVGDVVVNKKGEIYISGTFCTEIDFDPSAYTHKMKPLISKDRYEKIYNSFILKLNSAGQFMWVKRINVGGNFNIPNRLALDKEGNLYSSQMVFNIPHKNESIYLSCKNTKPAYLWKNSQQGDAFVVKMDSEGRFIWFSKLKREKETDGVSVRDMEINEDGALLITGEKFNSEGVNSYISKLDQAGNELWNTNLISKGKRDGNITSYSLKSIAGGSIYVTGYFKGRIEFNSVTSTSLNLIAQGNTDAFLLKIDNNGDLEWINQYKGGFDFYNDLASVSAGLDGNIYLCGYFQNYIEFKKTEGIMKLTAGKNKRQDTFIVKVDENGVFKSVTHLEGTTAKSKGKAQIRGGIIEVNNDEDIVMAGVFSGEVDFEPGQSEKSIKAFSFQDTYIAKYSLISY